MCVCVCVRVHTCVYIYIYIYVYIYIYIYIYTNIYTYTQRDTEWLRTCSDQDLLRFIRARSRNVYGHEWSLQGQDGEYAIVQDSWKFLNEHSKWMAERRLAKAGSIHDEGVFCVFFSGENVCVVYVL